MQAWEYRVLAQPDATALEALGAEGWELVGLDGGRAYLKRSAPTYRERVTEQQRRRALEAPPTPAGPPRLLQPDLYRIFAAAGHTDLITLADRGFPVPLGPERLDLAVADDLPTVLDILRLIRPLFPPDRLVVPVEVLQTAPNRVSSLREMLGGVALDAVPHVEFKRLAATARATVRTGDATPYANVIWVG